MEEERERQEEETIPIVGFHTIMDIPIHVLFDIMLKLPAASLVRCYSVCSKFKSIVSDYSFQLSYFSKAPISIVVLSDRHRITCIDSSQTLNPIHSSDHGSSSCMAMRLQPNSSNSNTSDSTSKRIKTIHHHHHNHQPSRFVSFHIHKRMNLINSSNGLLCLRGSNPHSQSHYYICNPLLGELLNIPPAPSAPDQNLSFSAFGFDPKTKTFKILQLLSKSNKLVAELYHSHSGGNNTWSVISDVPSAKPKPNSSFDPSLNDALHWVTDGAISELIYSFDLNSNKFKSIPCPSHFVDDEYVSKKISGMSVGVLKGCLCLCYVVEGKRFETWLMDKYGVKESWRMAFSIDIKSYCGWSPQDKHRPIGFNSCGDMWLMADSISQSSSQCLVSFNPETGVFRHIDIGGNASNIQVIPQVLSYVSMKHMVNIRRKQHQLQKLSSGKNYALGFNLFVLENFG